jgi:iron complex outermembrane receptor protein
VVNLAANWQATDKLLLATGIDNVFDRSYESHLDGYNRAANPNITTGSRLPSYGVNLFARVAYSF